MKNYAPFALRVGIGGLFVMAGVMKLADPSMIVGMLETMGFPVAQFWAWLLIFVELVCGAAVLVGFKLKYTTVPLALVLVVAAAVSDAMVAMNNIVFITMLISLWLSGPGAWSVSKT